MSPASSFSEQQPAKSRQSTGRSEQMHAYRRYDTPICSRRRPNDTQIMSDASRIKQQLENAFNGPAWHGPSLMENLKGVSAEVAAAKPVTGAHSIWEIINHL